MTASTKRLWKGFAVNFWEKKPLLIKNFKSPISSIDQHEIFSMLVDYSNHCRKLNDSDGFKLYVNGRLRHPEETLQFLPEEKDKSLLNYHSRMEIYFSDYCLVCDELLQTSQKNWSSLQEFTSHLFSYVGFPYRFVELGLYLGNYRQTPFGVHVDGCGVFSFPVVGKKTFRLWTDNFAKKNPSLDRAHNYSKFKKDSEVLQATPGDMTYWPSKAWHIAESNGDFTATWSLGVWVDRSHHESVEVSLRPLLKSKLGSIGASKTILTTPIENDGEVASLPKNYLESILKIKKISEVEMHDTLMKAWLTHRSTEGFKTHSHVKKTRKQKLISIRDQIQLKHPKSIFWTKTKAKPHQVLYAFHGILFEGSFSSAFLKLIKDLNAGKKCIITAQLTNNDLKTLQNLKETGAFI